MKQLCLYILSFQLGKIDWLVDLQSFMSKHKIGSKPPKYLISPIIERIRKWRSEAKHYSNKITKLQENSKFTPVSSNSSLVLEGGAILENVETGSRIPELQDCQNNKDLTTVN